MRKSACLTAALLGLLSLPVLAGQVYKWTDDKGQVHYSETPPPSSAANASTLKLQTRAPEGSAQALEARAKAQEERAKAAAEKAKQAPSASPATPPAQYAERCKQLRGNLDTLNNYGRVRISDDKGENRVMTDEEKQQKIDDTQRQIKAYCES